MPFYRNVAGVWKPQTLFRNVAGVWKLVWPYRKVSGTWKLLNGNVITVGVASGSVYGYNNATGAAISPPSLLLGSLGLVTPILIDDAGGGGGLNVRLSGAYANSGWTTLYVRSPAGVQYSYLRSAATFSTPSGLATVWNWGSGVARPFGTVVGATAYVMFV